MNIDQIVPVIVYDNHCHLCTRFARLVNSLCRGRLTLVGHYSPLGIDLRDLLGSEATDMFWLIDSQTAFGGRSALLPLLRSIIHGMLSSRDSPPIPKNHLIDDKCHDSDTSNRSCNAPNAVFVRSASLLKNSKKISLSGHST